MKRTLTWFAFFFACFVGALAQDPGTWPRRVTYTLLDGSYLVDDCLVCGRPTLFQPLRGTFDLVLLQNTPPLTRYEIKNVDFVASPGFAGETHITGVGTYQRFEEFARLQDMKLAVQVRNSITNRFAFFTNNTPVATNPSPLIKVVLTETNGTLLQTFSLQLFAAPVREIWFSTTRALTSTNRFGPTNQISPGDLISNRGRVVRRNLDLVQRLGIIPVVPDLGLDAVDVKARGEILFSLPRDIWSERLGAIQQGDLLSDRGAIVKRNQTLLAAFGVPTTQPDAGLDAVQVMPDGEILFSTRSNLVVNSSLKLSHGDILSDRGRIFRRNQELLAKFHPATTNHDYGLDALRVLSDGQIWFSLTEGFTDTWLGPIQPGDLLSSLGYRVFSNQQLVAAFAPLDPSQDYGLDALFVVTDTKPLSPSPRVTSLTRAGNVIRLEWDGEGSVFQLEHAEDILGPWQPCSPILPDTSYEDGFDLTSTAGFYRLHQW